MTARGKKIIRADGQRLRDIISGELLSSGTLCLDSPEDRAELTDRLVRALEDDKEERT